LLGSESCSGDADADQVYPREVVKTALRHNAAQ
jgi:DNA repair protein RadC